MTKQTFFVQTLGGEKLLDKCREIFRRRERGLKFSDTFRIVFRILFLAFQTIFRSSIQLFLRPQFRSADVLGVVSPHLPVGKKFMRFCLV